jgi:hypothetical protein
VGGFNFAIDHYNFAKGSFNFAGLGFKNVFGDNRDCPKNCVNAFQDSPLQKTTIF